MENKKLQIWTKEVKQTAHDRFGRFGGSFMLPHQQSAVKYRRITTNLKKYEQYNLSKCHFKPQRKLVVLMLRVNVFVMRRYIRKSVIAYFQSAQYTKTD